MRPLLLAVLALSSAVLASPPPVSAADVSAQRVVYDIDDTGGPFLHSALTNIANQMEAAKGAGADVVVVLHGAGVDLLRTARRDPDIRHRVMALKREGVHIRVGARTLAKHRLDYRQDLFDVSPADVVPNGVAELVRLQQLGYVYVKP